MLGVYFRFVFFPVLLNRKILRMDGKTQDHTFGTFTRCDFLPTMRVIQSIGSMVPRAGLKVNDRGLAQSMHIFPGYPTLCNHFPTSNTKRNDFRCLPKNGAQKHKVLSWSIQRRNNVMISDTSPKLTRNRYPSRRNAQKSKKRSPEFRNNYRGFGRK